MHSALALAPSVRLQYLLAMTFLPILERELRVRARSQANYWGRFGVGLAALLLTVPPLLWSGTYSTSASVGRTLFDGLVAAAFLFSCAACLLTADTISAEAREGTLDLLLLTRVKTFDVLTGKFASSALAAVFALVAFLPVLALPLLAGGVTGGETFRKGLSLVALMFLALSAGLWASTSGRERFQTIRLAVLLVAGLVLVPALLGLIWRSSGAELAGPLGLFSSASDRVYKISVGRFWRSLSLVFLVGCLLLVGAVVKLRRGAPGERTRLTGVVARSAASPVAPSSPAMCQDGALRRASGPPGQRPLHWLLGRQRGQRLLFWLAAVLGLFQMGLYWPMIRFLPMGATPGWSWSVSLVGSGITGALFAWGASRFFFEARRSGELELLLTTPLGAKETVSAQWAVLKRLLFWPLLVMALPILLQGVAFLAFLWVGQMPFWRLTYSLSHLLGVANLVAGAAALCWLGMWFGLSASRQSQAVLWSVGLARGLPYCLTLVCSLLWNLLMGPLMPQRQRFASLAILGPQLLTFGLLVWLIRIAQLQLSLGLVSAKPLSTRQALVKLMSGAAAALRHARHWTPQ